jgi:serine phosphatase RsbU (regulator of sigma subunit)
MPNARFHVIERPFTPGSRLLILTDGITETESPAGDEFGFSGLEPYLLSQNPLAEIMAAVQTFSAGQEAQDDRTLLLLERTA